MNRQGPVPTDPASASTLSVPVGYRPGGCVALVVPGISLLLAVPADEPLVAECWETIRDAAGAHGPGVRQRTQRLLDLLKGTNSQGEAIGFALVATEQGWSRVAGSGGIAVRAQPAAEAGVDPLIWSAGSGQQNWSLPSQVGAFAIGDLAGSTAAGPAPVTYPLVAGVVMAGGIAAGRLPGDGAVSGSDPAAQSQEADLRDTRRAFFPKGAGAVPRGPQVSQQGSATPAEPVGARQDAGGTRVVQSIGFAALGSAPQRASGPSATDDEAVREQARLKSAGPIQTVPIQTAPIQTAPIQTVPVTPRPSSLSAAPAPFGKKARRVSLRSASCD
ncbi:hypothetical protein KGA66_24950, partial [Actinocrinis puniceicyclus]